MADISVRGARFHVQRLGVAGGPPIVFLHGLVMDNLASWYFTVANAAAAHSEVVCYDLRGHGRSERTPSGYTLDDMVLDLAGVLDATIGERPAMLVGNSFGGLLAVAFARRYPHRTAALALVDAHLGDAEFGERMARTLALTGAERDRRIADSFSHWLGRHSARKRTRLAESAAELVAGTSLVEDLRRTPPLGPEDFATIDAPVLALYGERSDLRARSELLLARVRRCTLVVLPGCSHSVLWEATGAVREGIVRFARGDRGPFASEGVWA